MTLAMKKKRRKKSNTTDGQYCYVTKTKKILSSSNDKVEKIGVELDSKFVKYVATFDLPL